MSSLVYEILSVDLHQETSTIALLQLAGGREIWISQEYCLWALFCVSLGILCVEIQSKKYSLLFCKEVYAAL